MNKKTKGLALVVLATLFWGIGAAAQDHLSRPVVIVRPEIKINKADITLGDIAYISAQHKEHQKMVSALSEIHLSAAPRPMASVTLVGASILAAIEQAGFDLDTLGYSVPPAVKVQREGRVVSKDDILPAVQQALAGDRPLDLQVRNVELSNSHIVPAGDLKVSAQRLGQPSGGRIPVRVEVSVNNVPAARFVASAIVDDWREVPVLNRTIERGGMIQADDLQLVRLNLYREPIDVVQQAADAVGRRTKTRLAAGETVRKSMIDIPPVLPRGKKVSMIYRIPGFVASATGVAMEDGHEFDIVKIRNEQSRRTVRARIIDSETVEVVAQ